MACGFTSVVASVASETSSGENEASVENRKMVSRGVLAAVGTNLVQLPVHGIAFSEQSHCSLMAQWCLSSHASPTAVTPQTPLTQEMPFAQSASRLHPVPELMAKRNIGFMKRGLGSSSVGLRS